MQITEQIIQRIARQVFNQMFPSSLRQSGAVISGAGSSVQYAVEAGHAASADSAESCTGNAATATKLATARTLWGQSFDGSANVSGALSSVTNIAMSGKLKIGSIYIEAQTDYIEIYKLDANDNKIAASLCAYGGVTALGVGTGGGGGGGTSLDAVWTAMANATNEQINISHLAGTNGALATMTGYTTSDKNYAVQRDASNHLYVNVPWTDHYAWSDITGKPTKLSDFTNDVVSASVSGSTLTVNVGGTDYSLTDTNTWRPVVDNLTSTDTDKSLSANQGKVLNDNFANYLPLAGGTMTGKLTLKGSQYSGNYALDANNSDIGGLNALEFADVSDDYTESIRFPRTAVQGVVTYDTIRAADGTFYFGFASGSEFITMTGSMIKHERTDSNDVIFRAKNTNGSISLYTSTNRGVYDDTGGGWLIATNGTDTWLSRGKVGIGTSSPSYKLHVDGDIYATGGVTCLSDIRQKNVETYQWQPALSEIADAPIAIYTIKDDADKHRRVGSIAQYWQKVMPETVREGADGILSMDYGTISLVSVIALAREVKRLKEEVERLKKN